MKFKKIEIYRFSQDDMDDDTEYFLDAYFENVEFNYGSIGMASKSDGQGELLAIIGYIDDFSIKQHYIKIDGYLIYVRTSESSICTYSTADQYKKNDYEKGYILLFS